MASTLYIFGPLIILVFSIPLTIFATITSSFAFTVLLIRVSIVYFELTLALVQSFLSSFKPGPPAVVPVASPKAVQRVQNSVRRRRRSSSAADSGPRVLRKNGSKVSLLGTNDPNRDFEGLGGWRLDTEKDDAVWLSINSRLQLPTPGMQHPPALAIQTPTSAGVTERPKRHNRSMSSQSQRYGFSPETFRMSPMESRNRTPPMTAGVLEGRSPEGYFDINSDLRMMSAMEITTKVRMEERRASLSSSNSVSSSGTRGSRTSLNVAPN